MKPEDLKYIHKQIKETKKMKYEQLHEKDLALQHEIENTKHKLTAGIANIAQGANKKHKTTMA